MAGPIGAAVVTGASSGIGRALAVALAAEGVKVGVTARRKDLLDDLLAEVRGKGGTIAAEPADVTDRAGLGEAIRKLEAANGPTELLIANAGIGLPSEVGPDSVANRRRIRIRSRRGFNLCRSLGGGRPAHSQNDNPSGERAQTGPHGGPRDTGNTNHSRQHDNGRRGCQAVLGKYACRAGPSPDRRGRTGGLRGRPYRSGRL